MHMFAIYKNNFILDLKLKKIWINDSKSIMCLNSMIEWPNIKKIKIIMNSCKNTSKKASNIHNFKGIYFNNEPEEKMLDLSTGAHFKYIDMYHRLQVVVDIRKSEERAKQSPLPIWSTVDKRSRSIEDSFDYSWIKQKSLLSRLPVQINSQISHNHKTNNPHSDKLNNIPYSTLSSPPPLSSPPL